MCEKCTLETDNRCSNGGSECATPLHLFGYKSLPGLSSEESEEFKLLGKLKLHEITKCQFERYKFLLHKTLEGFGDL